MYELKTEQFEKLKTIISGILSSQQRIDLNLDPRLPDNRVLDLDAIIFSILQSMKIDSKLNSSGIAINSPIHNDYLEYLLEFCTSHYNIKEVQVFLAIIYQYGLCATVIQPFYTNKLMNQFKQNQNIAEKLFIDNLQISSNTGDIASIICLQQFLNIIAKILFQETGIEFDNECIFTAENQYTQLRIRLSQTLQDQAKTICQRLNTALNDSVFTLELSNFLIADFTNLQRAFEQFNTSPRTPTHKRAQSLQVNHGTNTLTIIAALSAIKSAPSSRTPSRNDTVSPGSTSETRVVVSANYSRNGAPLGPTGGIISPQYTRTDETTTLRSLESSVPPLSCHLGWSGTARSPSPNCGRETTALPDPTIGSKTDSRVK